MAMHYALVISVGCNSTNTCPNLLKLYFFWLESTSTNVTGLILWGEKEKWIHIVHVTSDI